MPPTSSVHHTPQIKLRRDFQLGNRIPAGPSQGCGRELSDAVVDAVDDLIARSVTRDYI